MASFGLFWVIDISGNDFIDLSVLAVILILDLVSRLSMASTKVHHGVDLFCFLEDLAGFLNTFLIWSLIRYTLFGIGSGLGANHIWRLSTNP